MADPTTNTGVRVRVSRGQLQPLAGGPGVLPAGGGSEGEDETLLHSRHHRADLCQSERVAAAGQELLPALVGGQPGGAGQVPT